MINLEDSTPMDSMEVLKWLDDEQRGSYMTLERLFESDGWSLVMERIVAQALSYKEQTFSAQSWDEANTARGAALAYADIANLSESMMREFAMMAYERMLDTDNGDPDADV